MKDDANKNERPLCREFNFKSNKEKPTDSQDGRKFLLVWPGNQCGIYQWSARQQDFYDNNAYGYLANWSHPFYWCELSPDLFNLIKSESK